MKIIVDSKYLQTSLCILLIFSMLLTSFPMKQNNAEAVAPIVAMLGILLQAAAIGAAIGGTAYVVEACLDGDCFDDWNNDDFFEALTIGALYGIAYILVGAFGPPILQAAFEAADVPGITEQLGNAFGDFFRSCVSNINYVMFSNIENDIKQNSSGFDTIMLPILEDLCNANGSMPYISDFDPMWADFSTESIQKSGMGIDMQGVEYNSSYQRSWKMCYRGTSYIRMSFDIAEIPPGIILSLNHLTSNVPQGGYSPIDITINGHLFADNYDVAQNHNESHSYEIDRWQISKYLVPGHNTIILSLEDNPAGNSCYWIQSAAIVLGTVDGIDVLPPFVIQHNYSQVPNTDIYIKFSENMNQTTFTNSNIQVIGSSTSSHSCQLSFNNINNELRIDPITDFDYYENVNVYINDNVQDIAGNKLTVPYTFQFSIKPEPVISLDKILPDNKGNTNTKFQFAVTYTDPDGQPPDPNCPYVVIDNKEYLLTPQGTDYRAGVVYKSQEYSFPVGVHTFHFEATQSGVPLTPTGEQSFIIFPSQAQGIALTTDRSSVPVDGASYATITAQVDDGYGNPKANEELQLSSGGFLSIFMNTSGQSITKVTTNASGIAVFRFRPTSSGTATITVTASSNASKSINITGTASTIDISMRFRNVTGDYYEVTAYLYYVSNGNPVVNANISWNLSPTGVAYWNGTPEPRTNAIGEAIAAFNASASSPTTVTVTATHVSTGISGSSSILIGGAGATQMDPWKNFGGLSGDCDVVWSPDNTKLAGRGDSQLIVWRTSDWSVLWQPPDGGLANNSVSFSSNNSYVATDNKYGNDEFTVYNAENGNIVNTYDCDVPDRRFHESMEWKGSYLIIDDAMTKSVCLYSNPQSTLTFLRNFVHSNVVRECRFNPANSSVFAAVDEDGWLKVWNINNSSSPIVAKDISTEELQAVAWSNDGAKIAVGGDEKIVYVLNASNLSQIQIISHGSLSNIESLDFSPDNQKLAVSSGRSYIFNANTGVMEKFSIVGGHSARWNNNGTLLATGNACIFAPYDITAPNIIVDSPASGSSTMSPSVNLLGRAIDPENHGVSATYNLNNTGANPLTLDANGAFNQSISLNIGDNTIVIEARDNPGNTSSITLNLRRLQDTTPPSISNVTVIPASGEIGQIFTITANIADPSSGINPSTVNTIIKNSNETIVSTISMNDNGTNGDIQAGDGIFTCQWNSTGVNENTYFVDISASDNSGNPGGLQKASSIGVFDLPIISQILYTSSSPTDTNSINVSANISDGTGIATATLRYSSNGGNNWSAATMSNSSGIIWQGIIPPQLAGNIQFKIEANDVLGHNKTSNINTFTVIDKSPPNFSNWLTEPSFLHGGTPGPLNVTVVITDIGGSGLNGSPQLRYKYGEGGIWGSYSNMVNMGNNTWSFDIPKPSGTWLILQEQYVIFQAKSYDIAGNFAESQEQRKWVNKQPCIVTITGGPSGNPAIVDSGGTANLSVVASDSVGHGIVSYIWQCSSGLFSNSSIQNPTWTAPANNTNQTVYYTIYVTVTCSNGKSAISSYQQGVKSVVTLPILSSFNINTGSTTTTSQTVTLNNTYTGGTPTQYMASESSSFSGATWQTYSASPSFTLSSSYGVKTVYLKLQNTYGFSGTLSDTIDYTSNMDIYEPDNTLETIKPQSINTKCNPAHSINPAGDEDWVSFTLNNTSNITIETSGQIGDTVVYLVDQSFQILAYDDDSGIDYFSKLTSTSLPAGTYYIYVFEYWGTLIIPEYYIEILATPINIVSSQIIAKTTTPASANVWNIVGPSVITLDKSIVNNFGAGFGTTWIAWRWNPTSSRWEVPATVGSNPVTSDPFDAGTSWLYALDGNGSYVTKSVQGTPVDTSISSSVLLTAGGNLTKSVEGTQVDIITSSSVPLKIGWKLTKSVEVTSIDTTTSTSFSVPLKKGWNLICNPFDFSVAWSDSVIKIKYGGNEYTPTVAKAANYVDNRAIWFNPDTRAYVTRYSNETTPYVMLKTRGQWLYSAVDGAYVVFPPVAYIEPPPLPAPPITHLDDSSLWKVELTLRSSKGNDIVEAIADNKEQMGLHDIKAPSLPISTSSISFIRDNNELSSDRQKESNEMTWTFEINASEESSLGWKLMGIPDDYRLTLEDETGKQIDIKQISNLPIDKVEKSYILKATRMIAPKVTRLLANYPNPFNPDTWIPYELSEGSEVVIKIYTSAGNLVRTLNLGRKEVGYYTTQSKSAHWDGKNESGERVSSGVYFYSIKTAEYTSTRKMVVVK